MARGTRKEYQAGNIAVSFDSALCIHAAECVRGLPSVFAVEARPWIQPGNASEDEVIEVVNRCPSGALQWRTLQEPRDDDVADEEASFTFMRNGPIYVRGDITLLGGDGEPLLESHRFALCRCGHSENKPFCDNSHRKVNWKS